LLHPGANGRLRLSRLNYSQKQLLPVRRRLNAALHKRRDVTEKGYAPLFLAALPVQKCVVVALPYVSFIKKPEYYIKAESRDVGPHNRSSPFVQPCKKPAF
jgi:hypothetical protein